MDETQGLPPALDLDAARAKAAQDLKLPALIMMGMGGLWLLYSLFGLYRTLTPEGLEALHLSVDKALEVYPPELRAQARAIVASFLSPTFLAFSALPGICLNGLVVFGAWKMKNLQLYGLAMTVAIICCIPCCGPMWGLGLIPGIWSLVVLNRPQVKAAFSSK
ncbi:hypothetical protein D7Y27_40400 [Corallococcus sp. AB004]|uniref:hypothetical protein n=1 Tax=Corallococcus TaxID=83461 RepID=UPI000EA33F76|nr:MULTISPECIES: hypothetical protein [Corallococcus]NPD29785.1 hypothetical protein [Corallococcus exiguus]RKI04734.1 hypothetical protein D7Y04_07485 [Corallococcus sp. AB038B]RKI29294.1 hypothetical protein D7Y27_40400 [Corallococcus sp. AB004]